MKEEFDKEKILSKMREIRDKRDLEILNNEINDINLDSDYKNEVLKNKVLNVSYLGKIFIEEEKNGEIDKVLKEIYLVKEQKEENGVLDEIYRYYTEDFEIIAGNNLNDEYSEIILIDKFLDNEDILIQLKNLNDRGILDLQEMEQQELEEIANAFGIKVEDLKNVNEIIENREKNEFVNERSEEVLDKKEIDNIGTKTEIKSNQKVTDRDTMSSLLNVEDKGYKKIAIIYSDKLKDSEINTKFAFVGIKEDGTVEKIDTLEQGYGNAPTKGINAISRDGSKIEEEQVNSIYKINGEKENQLAVKIGAMGVIEASFVRTPRQDNEEAVSIPIETTSIKPTTRETREFMNKKRNTRVIEEIERIEKHEDVGCNPSLKDIKDNPNEYTHEHLEIASESYMDLAREILKKNEELGEVYNVRDVAYKLEDSINKPENENSTKEELLKEVVDDLKYKAQEEQGEIGGRIR